MSSSGGAARRLPDGFTARLRGDLIRITDTLLVGGSPLRAVRLSLRAAEYVEEGAVVVRDYASAELAARLIDGNLADPEPAGVVMSAADLTVVVPVRDRVVQLDRCLAGLRGLACVVVDDGSVDPGAVADVVVRHGATIVPLAQNLGPAAARNAGMAHVRTPYIAFVDSDIAVSPASLLGLAGHFADPAVALVGPVVQGRSRSERPRWFERYDAAVSSLDLGTSAARVRPGSRVAWLPSACLVGRVDVLRAVGGFDEQMRVGEDVDLVWRLVDSGAIVRYDPGYRAFHDTRATVRGWLARKYVYGTGGADLAARHGDRMAPAVLSPLLGVAAAAVLMRRRAALPLAVTAILTSARSMRRSVSVLDGEGLWLSLDIAARGLGWSVRQESALLVRHWLPPVLVAALLSRRARRMVLTAVIVDTFVASANPSEVDVATAFAARRLDDLAYGLGLWSGAVHRRSIRCVLPATSAPR